MQGTGAFFRLEGALCPIASSRGTLFLAASAPGMRRRLLGGASVALGLGLGLGGDAAFGRKIAWSALRGLSRDRIEVLGEDFARDELLPAIRPSAARIVREQREAGRTLVLVSDSIDAIALPLARELGFVHVLCNALEYERDVATGALRAPEVGAEIDPRRVRELATANEIDLTGSCAYGSSRGDGLLLSLVGLPCALEPDRELARVARDLDWPIVRSNPSVEATR